MNERDDYRCIELKRGKRCSVRENGSSMNWRVAWCRSGCVCRVKVIDELMSL